MRTASVAWLFLLASAAHSRDERTVDQVLRQFHRSYAQAANDDQKIAAIKSVVANRDAKVAKALFPLLASGTVPVRIVVARELGAFRGVDSVPASLLAALSIHANESAKARGVRITILRSLGGLKVADAAPAVEKLIKNRDPWIAKAAVDAAGQIRAKSSVGVLIEALCRVEGSAGDRLAIDPLDGMLPPAASLTGLKVPGSGALPGNISDLLDKEALGRGADGSGGGDKEKPKTEREILKEPLHAALQSITRRRFPNAREWSDWWGKSKAKFQVAP